MSKRTVLCVVAIVVGAMASPAGADTFTAGSSGVSFAVNDNGFFVKSTQIDGTNAQSKIVDGNFQLGASGTAYSDAGIALYFDGSKRLDEIQSVSVAATGSPLGINLWLDTGSDGAFFAFDGNSMMTNLNGDSYGGNDGNGVTLDDTSSIYMFGGNGAGNAYTLALLKAGTVPGIDGDTKVSLWIGVTNGGGGNLSAAISSITVVPEPGTLVLLVTAGLGALAYAWRRRRS
jgi:hypothetical protein